MTGNSGKRMLPPLPNPDYLRKEAKTRLVALKAKVPRARLADVQFTLAREYGFENWGALMAEVALRTSGPRGAQARVRRAHLAVLPSGPRRFDQPPDDKANAETVAAFFRAGMVAQIGFIFAALTGVSMLFLTHEQVRAVQAVVEQLAQLPHHIL